MLGLVAIVELNKHLTMKITPIYKRVNGALRHVLLNSSNTELAPCMAGPAMMEHFVTIALSREAPSFALKGEPLSVELFADTGMAHSANMHLIALPRTMPCGYGKEWIEGSIHDPSVVDRFEAEYGPERGTWLRAIKSSFEADVTAATGMVYERLRRASRLEAHIGANFGKVTISPGDATVYVAAMNRLSHQDEYNEIKLNVGPYTLPPAAVSAPAAGVGFL